jgi:hypothetical protein
MGHLLPDDGTLDEAVVASQAVLSAAADIFEQTKREQEL